MLAHLLLLASPCHMQVSRLVGCMAEAVAQVAAKQPVCAVIHTTLPPAGRTAQLIQTGGCDSSSASSVGAASAHEQPQGLAQPPAPYLMLQQPVTHELLLPQIDLAVHHGGAGTVQAALLAGGRGRRLGRGR